MFQSTTLTRTTSECRSAVSYLVDIGFGRRRVNATGEPSENLPGDVIEDAIGDLLGAVIDDIGVHLRRLVITAGESIENLPGDVIEDPGVPLRRRRAAGFDGLQHNTTGLQ